MNEYLHCETSSLRDIFIANKQELQQYYLIVQLLISVVQR
jgi:hypothetical protein